MLVTAGREGAALALLGDLGEEVVALVVDEDERGEVLYFDFPDSLHAELGVFEKLNFLDTVLGEDGSGAADGPEVETAMLVACVCNLLASVALGNHHH